MRGSGPKLPNGGKAQGLFLPRILAGLELLSTRPFVLAVAFSGLMPGVVLACALPPSVILTLPTFHYILAAALTVAATALFMFGAGQGYVPQFWAKLIWPGRRLLSPVLTSYFGFAALLVLLVIGWLGPRDPMHNLLTLVFWTGVWVALPLASMIFGDLWGRINPWTGPVRITRRALGWQGSIGLKALGAWPAVLGLAAFSWFQMIWLYPDDPAVLAALGAGWWLVIFILSLAEGEDWIHEGEFLTLLFGMIAKISPLWRSDQGVMLGWPGSQLARARGLSLSRAVFVTLVLASLTFDGLHKTFFWHALIGENPLEPGGRSAVVLVNSAGFLAVWVLTMGLLYALLGFGRIKAQSGPIMLSFLAIAAGYHAAHYLVMLLTAGQYTLAALNDPFLQGDSYLALPPFYVSFGFLTDRGGMSLIYAAQFFAILGAHLLALILSQPMRPAGPGRWQQVRDHLPITVFMVAYTVLGLWLISTARIG